MSKHRYVVRYRLYPPTDPRFYGQQPTVVVTASNRAHAMRLVPDALDAEPVK